MAEKVFLFMEHYKRFFNPAIILKGAWKSLVMAVHSTRFVFNTIGYPFAYFLTKFKLKVRNTFNFTCSNTYVDEFFA